MIVKINAWKTTGETKWIGGFGWAEQRLEKVMLDTDLVEVYNPSYTSKQYGYPYDEVRLPYKKPFQYPFKTTTEDYRKLLKVLGEKVVEI